ncbi:hypothetical protein [Streptomyces neyagawaensis]|uniref:Uncharacterized protein n=1 Tax=Streptomyces neyagawaensis TaxID=42238 RepID=A0ABV3B2D0_9ACTN
MRKHLITTATAAIAGAAVLLTAAPANASIHKTKPKSWNCGFDDACTKNTRSGPGSAKVYRWYLGDFEDTLIRVGNRKYGLEHIKRGGSTGNKANHPYNGYAMSLWDKAINNFAKGSKGHVNNVSTTHTYKYGRGKKKRTMCVVTMERDLKLDGKNYGLTGIWTAYWVKGHVGWKGCKKG